MPEFDFLLDPLIRVITRNGGGHATLPDVFAEQLGRPTPMRTLMFCEIDEKPGWYVGLSWEELGLAQLHVLYYYSKADP